MNKNKFVRLCDKTCKKCKIDCCAKWIPFFSEFDKKRIRKINQSENLFEGNRFNTKNKKCPFYNKVEKKCGIHDYRPLDCRIYPYSFWFEMGRLDLWLDLKCPLTKSLIKNKNFYNEAMKTAKKELAHWSEGEIFGYLIADFDIEKFKKQVVKKSRNNYFKN